VSTAQELAALRAEVRELRLAVGLLGQTLFQVNGHRVPLELRSAILAYRDHAGGTNPFGSDPVTPDQARPQAAPPPKPRPPQQ
jgi:hypothetical protein